MKRVAHVLWRSRGGIRRHVRTLAAHPPCGFETERVYGPPDLASYFADVPFAPISRTGLLTAGWTADVVHAHGITAGVAALRPRRPPVVVSIHVVVGASGRTARSRIAQRMAGVIGSRADAVIAVSDAAASGFSKAIVIPPAFDPLPAATRSRGVVREELGASTEDIVVVTVSRLEREKRLDLFVRAVRSCEAVGWVVGDGPERRALGSEVDASLVRILGHRDDVPDLLGAADVFALASASESYGIAVAEAVDAGLPIVATRTGSIADIVGDAGIIVDVGDDDAFIGAVTFLVGDPAERAQLRARAAGSRPDRDALIARVGRIYETVTA